MAAVEDPAGLTSIESATGLASIDTDPCNDMKNTARKSTCKAAQRATPPPVVNGNAETNNGNHVVANGDGPHKRPLEEEDLSNAAKSARLQIEEMEKAQEEMTKKVSREEDMVTQNGETEVSNGGHVEDNPKDSKPSSPSPNNTNSLALTADVRDTFKGILDVAMAKVGSRRSSANDSETLLSPDSPSQGGKEDGTLNQTGEGEDTAKQENGKEDDESKSEKVEEPTESNGEAACPEAELLDGETGEADQSGEVDEAILLSDDDGDGSKEHPAIPESKTSQPSTEVSDESSERKEKDSITEKDNEKEVEIESEDAIKSSEPNEKASEENEETATPTTAVEKKEEEEEKNEEEVDKVSEAGKSEKEVKDSASEEMAEEDKKDSEDESEGKARSKADIPADKVINLDDDDDNDAGHDDNGDDNGDTKVVGESKLESDINHPIEIEDDDDNADLKSEASDTSSTRKRGAPSPAPSDTSSTTKKSRLDKVIGRLGSAVGINSADSPTPAAMPAAESNDDEKPTVGDAEVKNDVEMTDDVSTDVKPDATNDVKPDVTSTETPAIKSRRKSSQEVREDIKPEIKRDPKAEKKLITLSVEELNELLVKRMNAFLERSRGSLIVQLQTRIGELQTAVESWRAQAKRLAKQLDDEVARSSQRRHGGKMARRRTNSDDVRMAQVSPHSGSLLMFGYILPDIYGKCGLL